MPLNLSNRDQNSGHLFYNRRLRAAITRFSVRMKHDDRKQQAAVALSIVLVVIGIGWMALLHVMKPSGLVGQSSIIGDRDTGAVYAKINGRLYPALNLTSARLAVGSAGSPTWVKANEIAKYPTGPIIGIPGAPDSLPVTASAVSAWSVCDAAAARGSGTAPVVTAIAGQLSPTAGRSRWAPTQAILATHKGATYVIWRRPTVPHRPGGPIGDIQPRPRPRGDLPDRNLQCPVRRHALNGTPCTACDSGVVGPRRAGCLVRSWAGCWRPVTPTAPSTASMCCCRTACRKSPASSRTCCGPRIQQGSTTPTLVAPDKLIQIPVVDVLDVDYYPSEKLDFVDTAANPATCVGWQKQSGDPQARITIFTGRGLPVPIGMDSRLVRLVRDDRDPNSAEAQQTLVLPGAANFVTTTSGVATADSRESLYWISPQGVRYGIQSDHATLQALGLDPRLAVQAPWPIVRTFATGPAIGRDAALVARDAVTGGGAVAPIPDLNERQAGVK